MKNEEIVKALRGMKVETRSLVCLGCGYEHHCGHYGCAIIRAAADALDNQTIEIQSLRNAAHGFQERMEAAEAQVKALQEELADERYRHDRLQDFEVEEAKQLEALKEGAPAWISVKDRLPDIGQRVLCIDEAGTVHMATGWIDWPDKTVYFCVPDLRRWLQSSYWMLLPEAPTKRPGTKCCPNQNIEPAWKRQFMRTFLGGR